MHARFYWYSVWSHSGRFRDRGNGWITRTRGYGYWLVLDLLDWRVGVTFRPDWGMSHTAMLQAGPFALRLWVERFA